MGGAVSALVLLWSMPAACQGDASAVATARALGEDPVIRVLVVESAASVGINPREPWRVVPLSGAPATGLAPGVPVKVVAQAGELELQGGPAPGVRLGREGAALECQAGEGVVELSGWSNDPAAYRAYTGRIEIRPNAEGKLSAVAALRMEEYLRGVVPSEMGGQSPAEALCAQAVAGRSAALLALTTRMYAGEHHDICSTVQCQVYAGVGRHTEACDAAVRATRGWIMTFEGAPLAAYYSANCGGHGEDIRHIWPERSSARGYWNTARFDAPTTPPFDLSTEEGLRQWLLASPEVYCSSQTMKAPEWAGRQCRWTREIPSRELSKWVAEKKTDIGLVREIRVGKRGRSGRLGDVRFVGDKGTATVSTDIAIRRLFRPALRSSAFVVDTKQGPDGAPLFVLHGAGSGHGVGMCQTGAMGMANEGKNFREIMAHYYPKARLERLY